MLEPSLYYGSISALSFLLGLVYLYKWRKRFDVHMTLTFVLIPIANMAYYMMYTNTTIDAAMLGLKIIYLGGCYLPWLITMCVASLCNFRLSRFVRLSTFLVTSLVYISVLTVDMHPYFYKSMSFARIGSNWVLHKEYGPLHTLHYIVICLYLLADVVMIFYAYRKKQEVSRRILLLLFIPIPVTVFGYFAQSFTAHTNIEAVPVAYVFAQIVYLFIIQRMAVYNVSDMAVESLVQSGDTGFVSVDFMNRYLGSNETARQILPALNKLAVDGVITESPEFRDTILSWIHQFIEDEASGKDIAYRRATENGDERIYKRDVNYLYDGRKRCGYQIFLEDDTQNQKYINLLAQYNSDLKKDVAAKTERIVEMHDRLILGMATMVESRDNSTGGHIRRTSEGVRILIEEMKKDSRLNLTETFCKNIIKAAPMHDLGKIAVDDTVLRKNGPFTPEEREKMKMHAAEGARIVSSILQDTDDVEFRRIAENVAHYHHEKVDGTGYPDGLKGDEIPFEARIMAIADVYDALVSKRVYKEKFSFEKADRIIEEGMGTQFDAGLRQYYEAARPRLEAFYTAEG